MSPTHPLGKLKAYQAPNDFYTSFQTTIGKTISKSTVINVYCNKPDFKTIVLRSLARLIPWDIYTFIYNARGWHDNWTDTFVVDKAELRELKRIIGTETTVSE